MAVASDSIMRPRCSVSVMPMHLLFSLRQNSSRMLWPVCPAFCIWFLCRMKSRMPMDLIEASPVSTTCAGSFFTRAEEREEVKLDAVSPAGLKAKRVTRGDTNSRFLTSVASFWLPSKPRNRVPSQRHRHLKCSGASRSLWGCIRTPCRLI